MLENFKDTNLYIGSFENYNYSEEKVIYKVNRILARDVYGNQSEIDIDGTFDLSFSEITIMSNYRDTTSPIINPESLSVAYEKANSGDTVEFSIDVVTDSPFQRATFHVQTYGW